MTQDPGRGAQGPPTPADHVDTQDLDLSHYQASPPSRSAYPGPDEGGLHIDPLRPPEDGAPPGPGYGDPAATAGGHQAEGDRADGPQAGGTAAAGAEPFDATWMVIGIIMALLVGGLTILGLITTPAVVTAGTLVVIAAALVLSWPAAAVMRRTVLLAISGPAGVLIGYWLVTLVRG